MKQCIFPITLLLIAACAAYAEDQADKPPVTVGLLAYDQANPPQCVGTLFLEMFNWQTGLPVNGELQPVELADKPLPDLPLMFLTGDRLFELTDEQGERLYAYLKSGGTIIASSSCANAHWNNAFVANLDRIVPDGELREMSLEHPIFNKLFEIDHVRATHESTDRRIAQVMVDGRAAIIFAPGGLNDTAKAGKDRDGIECCCCGADELRDAHLINANILAWVMDRR